MGFKIDTKSSILLEMQLQRMINMLDDGRAPRTYIYISDDLGEIQSSVRKMFITLMRVSTEMISKIRCNEYSDSNELYLKDAPHDVWVDIDIKKNLMILFVNLEEGINRCIEGLSY